ncbi:MAG: NUDIX hydrolase [Rhodospirillales bacterium]|nr:NUDIX hydrolase [Rhodospirillales bacterium]
MINLVLVGQVGVLPYRIVDGDVECMLVTSRTSRRWIVPKGHIEPGLTARETARFEAFEEAGLSGVVARRPIGSYVYTKRREKGGDTCRVRVYPMEVVHQAEDYPESRLRERAWYGPEEAEQAVGQKELGRLIRKFAEERLARADRAD